MWRIYISCKQIWIDIVLDVVPQLSAAVPPDLLAGVHEPSDHLQEGVLGQHEPQPRPGGGTITAPPPHCRPYTLWPLSLR